MTATQNATWLHSSRERSGITFMPQISLTMKWVKQLVLENNFQIEKRVLRILRYFDNQNEQYSLTLKDIDATGRLGGSLASLIYEEKFINISLQQVLQIFEEDGQVFELNLDIFFNNTKYEIIITRGSTVDILGDNGTLPAEIIGKNIDLAIDLFNT